MNQAPKLTPGQALVLAGPQGCGKTRMAREIAAPHGPYLEIDATDLEGHFHWWMDGKAKTIIVDGLPHSVRAKANLKRYITPAAGEFVTVERKGMQPTRVPPPNFIFCTHDEPHAVFTQSERRFRVVRMGAGKGTQP